MCPLSNSALEFNARGEGALFRYIKRSASVRIPAEARAKEDLMCIATALQDGNDSCSYSIVVIVTTRITHGCTDTRHMQRQYSLDEQIILFKE